MTTFVAPHRFRFTRRPDGSVVVCSLTRDGLADARHVFTPAEWAELHEAMTRAEPPRLRAVA